MEKVSKKYSNKHRKAISSEAREQQLINLAMNNAEEQLRNGTASSQIISHFLKLGTTMHQLELEKTKNENLLLEVKIKSIESTERTEKLFSDAIAAMKIYKGEDTYDNQDIQ